MTFRAIPASLLLLLSPATVQTQSVMAVTLNNPFVSKVAWVISSSAPEKTKGVTVSASWTGRIAHSAGGSFHIESPDPNYKETSEIFIIDVPNRRTITLHPKSKSYFITLYAMMPASDLSNEYLQTVLVDGEKRCDRELNHPKNFEYLGIKEIFGFEAYGCRANGTGHIAEIWVSPLVGALTATYSDPANGKTATMTQTDTEFTEPDPSFFQIPPDYVPEASSPTDAATQRATR